jgi:tetrahydromethanopterin S-methyltransferase subunit G
MANGEQQQKVNDSVRRSITIAELGVIVSLICSIGSLLFTAGIIYGDVQRQTDRIDRIEPKVEMLSARIERIDANVSFLAEAAREARAAK